MKEIGERLKQARLDEGLTLRQLGDQVHYSPDHLSNLERGRRNPSLHCIILLAKELGRSMDYFIEEQNETSTK